MVGLLILATELQYRLRSISAERSILVVTILPPILTSFKFKLVRRLGVFAV